MKDILNDNILNRECIVLKNKNKVLYYKDIFNNKDNYFLRYIGNNILTFNLNGILLNKESNINCKTIIQNKIELIHDTKIVTLDIECYLGDHNQSIS